MIKCSSQRSTSQSQRRIKTRSLTLQTHQRRRHTRSNKHMLSTCTGMREQPAMHPTASALASMARLVTTSDPRSTVTTLPDAQSNQRKSGLVSPVPRVPLSSVNVTEPQIPNMSLTSSIPSRSLSTDKESNMKNLGKSCKKLGSPGKNHGKT